MSAIVPFGKYKGRSVDELTADQEYCNWLSAQPWFREKFSYIHQLVVVNHGEPADTPEHNAMQALFLDKRMQTACILQFSKLVGELRELLLAEEECEIRDIERTMKWYSDEEKRDAFRSRIAVEEAKIAAKKADEWLFLKKFHASASFEDAGYDAIIYIGPVYARRKIGVELKPSIGDDYPTVIRQIKKCPPMRALLIYETANWSLPDATARAVIENSGIKCRSLAEIQATAAAIPDAVYLEQEASTTTK